MPADVVNELFIYFFNTKAHLSLVEDEYNIEGDGLFSLGNTVDTFTVYLCVVGSCYSSSAWNMKTDFCLELTFSIFLT